MVIFTESEAFNPPLIFVSVISSARAIASHLVSLFAARRATGNES